MDQNNTSQWATVMINGTAKRLKIIRALPNQQLQILQQQPQIVQPQQFNGQQQEQLQDSAQDQHVLEQENQENTQPASVKVENMFWPPKSGSRMLDFYLELKQSPEYRYSKQDKKLWDAIATKLNALQPPFWLQPVTFMQVKNKFSNIKQQLSRKLDWNRQSGNDPKILNELEQQLYDIKNLLRGKEAKEDQPREPREECMNTAIFSDDEDAFVVPSSSSTPKTSFSKQLPVSGKIKFNAKAKHGTGSKVAQTKLMLETQWLEHLQNTKTADTEKKALLERHLDLLERSVLAKERSNELKHLYLTNKTIIHQRKEERFNKMYNLKMKELEIKEKEFHLKERQNAGTLFASQKFNDVLLSSSGPKN